MSMTRTPGKGEARVIIRDGRLTLAGRPQFLAQVRINSYRDALREAGTVVCDIDLDDGAAGERELTVTRSYGSELDDRAVEVLVEWAILVGCRRVWLPESVIDLGDRLVPAIEDIASEPCPTCGVRADDATLVEELAALRRRGPIGGSTCPACLSDRPQRLPRPGRG